MKSLLNKSLLQFIICTIIILFLATPLFYLLTEHFYAEDIVDVIKSIQRGAPIPTLDLKSDIMTGIMIQFVLIFFVLSLSFIVSMRFVTKSLWKPFYDTLLKIKRFNLEQNEIPAFTPTNVNEFVQMNQVISQLMHKDMESYKIQREFTENASHELQTPIAIFQSKLDLLLQEELTENQSKIVSELYSVSNRLNRLNKNLLLLAKIDNKQYGIMEKVDIIQFIEENLSIYKDLYNNHSLQLINKSRAHLIVEANHSLLESLFNNLIVNAIRHNPTNGLIEIFIENKTLIVSNDSDGIKLDETKLFQRFHNNPGKNRGNGLGLAIVKAICNYHGWEVKYSFNNNRHYFSVIFC